MANNGVNNQMGVIVKLQADASDAARKSFEASAQKLAKGIKPKITLDINVEATKENISKTIRSIMQDMGVEVAKATQDMSKQIEAATAEATSQSVAKSGKEKIDSDLKNYKARIQEILNLRAQLNNLSGLNTAFGDLKGNKGDYTLSFDTSGIQDKLSKAVSEANEFKASLKDAKVPIGDIQSSVSGMSASLKNIDVSGFSNIDKYASNLGKSAVSENITKVDLLKQKVVELCKTYNLSEAAIKRFTDTFSKSTRLSESTIASISSFSKQFNNYLSKNTKLQKNTVATKMVDGIKAELSKLYKQDGAIEVNLDDSKARETIAALRGKFNDLQEFVGDKDLGGTPFINKVSAAFEKFGGWSLVTRALTSVWRECKEVYNNVVLIDTAMTELKKVTDETDTTYERFLDNAAVRAKSLGTTLEDVVTSTADFARLGYSLNDATELADSAIVYKNVGDGIKDISTASESIISTMKAFDVEAKDSMSIVDKYNETGNNFAISSAGVGEALKRSASALAAANNTIDESIGLITAMNTVVQDPEKVGTTLKTVSMYLRASKTEAEEAGIEVDGMADSISKLRSEISSLTGGKVDILKDDKTYKSTYQILKEISEVWNDLSDVSQANLTERLAGKRNSNALLAVLNNFEIAEEAMLKSQNSAGSAMAENEKYLDSIQGRLDILSATFQEFSTTILSSDLVKNAVSFLSSVLGGLSEIINSIGVIPSILLSVATGLGLIKGAAKLGWISTDAKILGRLVKNINKAGDDISAFIAITRELKGESKGLTASINSAAEAIAGLSKASKAGEEGVASITASSVKAIGAAGLVVAAIGVAALAVQHNYKGIKKDAEEAASALDDTNSKVSSIQEKIKSNEQEISELRKSGLGDNSERIQGLQSENDKLKAQLELYEEIAKHQLTDSVDKSSKEFSSQRYDNSGKESNSLLYAGNNIVTAYTDAGVKARGFEAQYKPAEEGLLSGKYSEGTRDYVSQNVDRLKKQADEQRQIQKDLVIESIAQIDKLEAYREETGNKFTANMQSSYDAAKSIVGDYYSNVATEEERIAYIRSTNEYDSVRSIEDFGKSFSKIAGVSELTDKIKNGLNPSFEENKHVILGVINSSEGLQSIIKLTGMSEDELAEAIWESINGLDRQSSSADDAASALAKVKEEAENLSNSLKSLNDAYDLLKTAQDELNQYGNLSAGTLQNILEKYPELTDKVYEFISGQTTAKDLIASMSSAYDDDVNDFNIALANKLFNQADYYKKMNENDRALIDALAKQYDVDLTNCRNLEDAKLALKKGYAQRSLDIVGTASLKSAKISESAFMGIVKQLGGIVGLPSNLSSLQSGMQGIFNSLTSSNSINALVNEAKQSIERFAQIDIIGVDSVKYNPKSHLDSSFKSSSSKSSSGKTEAEKALEAAKKNFDAEHEVLENKLKRNLISEREYYNQLEALYKKYFAANTKYYLQYEAKVYEGRQKLLKSAKDDVDDFLDLVLDSIKDAKKAEKEALKDYLDDLEDLADARKKALDDLKDETDYLKKLANLRKSVADLENRLADAKLDNSAAGIKRQLELEEDLKNAKDELSEYEYEHSVETQKAAIDKELEAEKNKVNQQIEVLDKYLENQNALLTDAWAQIEGMNNNLYQKLIDWNKQYGSAIDQDVIDKWNAAKDALEAYGSVYRAQKTYEQMNKDISAKKAPAGNSSGGSGGSSGGSGSSGSGGSGGGKPSSVSAGSRAKASSGSKIYTGINGTAKNQYFKNDPVYTVLEVRGDWVKVRHHSLKSGVTGWFKKSDLTAYAKGVSSVPYDGLFLTQEAGQEAIIHNGGLITPLSQGDMVFNNRASQRLWELSNSPKDNWFIDGLKEQFDILGKDSIPIGNMTQQDNSVTVSFGDMYVSGNADADTLKQFRKELTSDVIKALNNSHTKRGYTLRPVKRT